MRCLHLFGPRARPSLTWLVALVMLMSACLPALAMVWGPQSSSTHWVNVCSAQGSRWVAVTDDGELQTDSPSNGSPTGTSSHCPWCLSHAPTLPLPDASGLYVAVVPLAPLPRPLAWLHGPHQQHAWSPLQSRAPPVLS